MDRMLLVKNAAATVKTIKTSEPQRRATGVAAGGHLAHDRQAARIGNGASWINSFTVRAP